jgi:hypothetical protein
MGTVYKHRNDAISSGPRSATRPTWAHATGGLCAGSHIRLAQHAQKAVPSSCAVHQRDHKGLCAAVPLMLQSRMSMASHCDEVI